MQFCLDSGAYHSSKQIPTLFFIRVFLHPSVFLFYQCWYLLSALPCCSAARTILEILQLLHHHQNLLLICRFLQFGFCCSSISCQSVGVRFSGCFHLDHELCTVKNLLFLFTPFFALLLIPTIKITPDRDTKIESICGNNIPKSSLLWPNANIKVVLSIRLVLFGYCSL